MVGCRRFVLITLLLVAVGFGGCSFVNVDRTANEVAKVANPSTAVGKTAEVRFSVKLDDREGFGLATAAQPIAGIRTNSKAPAEVSFSLLSINVGTSEQRTLRLACAIRQPLPVRDLDNTGSAQLPLRDH